MPPNTDLEVIRKAQIIDAALRTIAERGCADVTMDDICKAAGLSKGGLAHYYKSKNDLFKAAFQEFFQRIFVRGDETMSTFSDPLEQVLSFEWLYNIDDPDVDTGYPILYDFMSIAVHDQEYREIFSDWINNWVKLLSKAIRLGQSRGSFENVDAESAARTISAIYQGIATRWYLAPEKHSSEWAVDSLRRSVRGLLVSYENTVSKERRKKPKIVNVRK
ncbi:MAG TPA: TetR/AcrR family transcriptional regulator [Desulfomonilia bacterium]|nr:TetR/AcrR family transcriptional regulator [Desulfomonilia bacterium]